MTQYSFSLSFGNISATRIIPLLILSLIGFAIVHIIKLMRLYLVVMEQQIPFKRFVPAYLRTTLANIIIPYKIGEIYRVAVFSRITGSINVGFFSILIDRFFDTLALVIILLPYQVVSGQGASPAVLLLTAFLLVVIFAYIMFPSSYRYLNRYIIINKTSKRSMSALRVLEKINDWYQYVKGLVSGRYGLMLLFSLAAWLFEILVLFVVARLFNIGFGVSDFGQYISSILSTKSSSLSNIYTIYSTVVILIACVIFTIIYLTGKDEKKENR